MQRFLDPVVLRSISSLDLLAKTVVDGFVAGLHRSPDFGFSQDFAEYRAYVPGDDPRHVDWSLYGRTDRTYIRRYRGETNSQLIVVLDASNSMDYTSTEAGRSALPKKIDYARYLAASLFYLAIRQQRDAAGLIVFDDVVRESIRPSSGQGQLARLLAGLEQAEPRARTDFGKPLHIVQQLLRRRGIAVVISDFYENPEQIVRAIEPLRFHGNEVVLFHILDPQELRPTLHGPALLVDMETGQRVEVTPDYAASGYRAKIDAHVETLRQKAQAAGLEYRLLPTDQPLDRALREYLSLRKQAN